MGDINKVAAVFLAGSPRRHSVLALWRPDAPLPPGNGGQLHPLNVLVWGGDRLREVKVGAVPVPVAESLTMLRDVWQHPSDFHPALAVWAAAARIALEQIAARNVRELPGPAGETSWRIGDLAENAALQVYNLVAAFPPYAHAHPVPGDGPWRQPQPGQLVTAFMDAVADAVMNSVSAPGEPTATKGQRAGSELSPVEPVPVAGGVAVELRLVADSHQESGEHLVVQVRSKADASLVLDAEDLVSAPASVLPAFGPDPITHVRHLLADAARVWPPATDLLAGADRYRVRLSQDQVIDLVTSGSDRLRLVGVTTCLRSGRPG
ncbi:hypothetical protein [Streptomyces sp. NPDC056190]|uniref:hypothetical protein n=1 Tax=Streptomyces sp. NPDC056190 TaxID=3345741 RepID=UPI0035D6B523